ncbi:hypothetical protein [Pararhizobium mangrovi]|uniref:hypothetical protein n=1 Tax=Pararhizobium mangrovi TaxID=2590452 RepID=UPI0015E8462C|nr:hypothetical protein [Pararhizobium mangrovi]
MAAKFVRSERRSSELEYLRGEVERLRESLAARDDVAERAIAARRKTELAFLEMEREERELRERVAVLERRCTDRQAALEETHAALRDRDVVLREREAALSDRDAARRADKDRHDLELREERKRGERSEEARAKLEADVAALRSACEKMAVDYEAAKSRLVAPLLKERNALAHHADLLERRYDALLRSNSWRVTRPIRFVIRAAYRLARRTNTPNHKPKRPETTPARHVDEAFAAFGLPLKTPPEYVAHRQADDHAASATSDDDTVRAGGKTGKPRSEEKLEKRRDHAIPVFEGAKSRRHSRVPFEALRERALKRRETMDLGKVDTLVQFAGFPRSGHSIIGSLIDAHPAALVSHELDMVGLVEEGFSSEEIFALIAENSAAFEASGRSWNGHSYRVPGASGGRAEAPKLLGDKKGDWALRRLSERPEILSAVDGAFPAQRKAWISVVRNPFDNVATLSLRKGRHYDALRIAAGDETEFKARLKQERGSISGSVLPEMVEDYRTLCAGLASLKARVAPQDWLEVRHEAFVADPAATMATIFRFLGLAEDEAALAGAAAITHAAPNSSRHDIAWRKEDRKAVDGLVRTHDFLNGYTFDDSADGSARRTTVPVAPSKTEGAPESAEVRPLRGVRLFSCVGLDADAALLAPFLDHYIGLGLDPATMHLILNQAERDEAKLAAAHRVLRDRGVGEPDVWIGAYTSETMWERRREMQQRCCAADDWVVSADVDEFHVYPAPLGDMIAWMEENRFDVLDGPMIDRLAVDGTLPPITPERSLDRQFPLEADIMCTAGKRHGEKDATGTVTMMLFRARFEPGRGGHGPLQKNAAFAYGMNLAAFPRIKDPAFRFRLPARVNHFKWHGAVQASIERRMNTPGASTAGTTYGQRMLDYLAKGEGRVDVDTVPVRGPMDRAPADWKGAFADYRSQARAFRSANRTMRKAGTSSGAPEASAGWRVRQLTSGTGQARFHAHSYYDIPVVDSAERRAVAFESNFSERWMTPADEITIGLVDIEAGGFTPVGTSAAWSWQQGPMAQWHPSGERLFWNDRDGDAFVARQLNVGTGRVSTLPRPVYAVDPAAVFALGVNMARLDEARPGYGYTGGAGAKLEEDAPLDDGIWRMHLETGFNEIVLSLARAREALMAYLDREERDEHRAADRIYWFNHVKLSPSGKRFTAKFRWRDRGPKIRWKGTMGVSVTCGSDGTDLRILGRGTSHVMWLDDDRLYCWHQAEGNLGLFSDTAPYGTKERALLPETITRNVHIRHLAEDPDLWVLDTPYQERVTVALLDVASGEQREIAAFSNHVPNHGPFRCDLHPVPTRDGRRILVTSLHDGGRQLYVIEHESLNE